MPDARFPMPYSLFPMPLKFLPLLFLLCAGCSSVAPPKAFRNPLFDERPKTPGRMVAFWQCYTQSNLDGDMPFRGVGGRIQFYNEKNRNEPIKVKGDLTIFLFDANDPVPLHSVPVQQAVFQKETLSAFHRKDSLEINGYDFFVPVDELGNEEMELQVWAVFHEYKKPDKTTALIYSTPAVVTLPGPKRQNPASENGTVIDLAGGSEEDPYGITLASYQQATTRQSAQTESDSRRRQSETIPLPPRFTQAYQNAQESDWGATPEKTANPYMPSRNTVNTPSLQIPVREEISAPQNTSEWPRTPGRLLSLSQRSQAVPNDKPFRVDSNMDPTPALVHEEVSKSGVPTKVWVQ